MSRARVGAVAAASALLLAVAGCGETGEEAAPTRTVTGTCAADTAKYPHLSPLTAALVNAALGSGEVKANGTIRPDSSGVPATGSCTYFLAGSPTEHQVRLGVNQGTDFFRSVPEARSVAKTDPGARPIPGMDGFAVDKTKAYVDGTRATLSYAVAFTGPDKLVWVSVLTPEKAGTPSHTDEAVAALKRAVERLSAPV